MLKSIFLTAIRSLAVFLILLTVCWSSTLAENLPSSDAINPSSPEVINTQTPKGETSQLKTSDCDRKNGEDKKVFNPNCQKTPKISSNKRTYPQPPHPYNMEAIEKFDQELYGE